MFLRDRNLKNPSQRLYQLTVYGRWLFVVCCWLFFAPAAIWQLRDEIGLLRSHFTWSALRFAFAYHLFPSFVLFFCVGITGAVLVRQSLHILQGISPQERQRLEKQVQKIHASGPGHPLWKWVFGK